MTVPFKDWLTSLSPVTPADVDLIYIKDTGGNLSGYITWQSLRTLIAAATTAADVGITDAGGLYVATDVEAALAEVATTVSNLSTAAVDITLDDSGALYTAIEVESALAEVMTLAQSTDADLASTDAALAANGKGFVNHGSTASTARPTGFASIEWLGTVEPTNWIANDTWIDPS